MRGGAAGLRQELHDQVPQRRLARGQGHHTERDARETVVCTCTNNPVSEFLSQFFQFARWYDEKVSSLDICAPLTINPQLSVEQTIEIMLKEGYDQLPVINESG